jgi:predicted nucleic acid-binding protein
MGDSPNDPKPKQEHSLEELKRIERSGDVLLLPVIVPPEIAGTKNKGGSGAGRPAAQRERWAKASEYFESAHIHYLEADERIAIEAANLATRHQLAAGDAVVLASAIAYHADVLLTWDGNLLKLNDEDSIHIAIREPQALAGQREFVFSA